ncbi:hypothetical protein CYD30_28395 [Kosakonia cowanii]|nr:hypothetical protein CYD30_28395 [Kosakonia cowanii]
MNTVTINNKQLPAVEYRGHRVVTFAMIDEAHQRPEGTAGRNFRENRNYFVEGVDYVELGSDAIRRDLPEGVFSKFAPSGIVLFESGYLMVAKSLTDDLAWQVQRELVNSYFRQHRAKSQAEIIAEMALLNVEQERRLNHVEDKVEEVVETIENIKRGSLPAGWVGYSSLKAKLGMTPLKCKTLINAYGVPTDTHEYLTPDGLLAKREIVEYEPFMRSLRQVMVEAEQKGTRWYHPKMNLFQVLNWEKK